jgi:hypothetical protein
MGKRPVRKPCKVHTNLSVLFKVHVRTSPVKKVIGGAGSRGNVTDRFKVREAHYSDADILVLS